MSVAKRANLLCVDYQLLTYANVAVCKKRETTDNERVS